MRIRLTKKQRKACLIVALVAVSIAALVVMVVGVVNAYADTNVDDESYRNQPISQWSPPDVNGPAFNCPQNVGRPRITNGDVDQLIPCWNVSMHISIDAAGNPTLLDSNMYGAKVLRTTHKNYSIYDSDGTQSWTFAALYNNDRPDDTSTMFDVNLNDGAWTLGYEIYYRVNDGMWHATGVDFGDFGLAQGDQMEVVVAGLDKNRPAGGAPRPFNWTDAPKTHNAFHFKN